MVTLPRATGLVLGPAAWAVSTQAGYAAAALVCAHEAWWLAAIAMFALALVSLAAAYASWHESAVKVADGQPRSLLGMLGVGTGGLFSVVILLQGFAALTFTGCER